MNINTKSLIKITSIATIATLSIGQAQAEYANKSGGIYFAGNIGFNTVDDSSFSVSGGPAAGNDVDVDYDTGYKVGVAVGYDLTNSFGAPVRVELELSRQDNDADGIDFTGNALANEINVGGGFSSTNLIANGYYDIGNYSGFTPYVGAGIGVAFTDVDVRYGPNGVVQVNDNDTNLALQAILGVSYAISSSLTATVDVRYQRIFDVTAPRTAGPNLTGTASDDVDSISVNFGVRF